MLKISPIKLRPCLKYKICIVYRNNWHALIMIPAYCDIHFYKEANICFGFRVICIIYLYLNIWFGYIKNIWSCNAMWGYALVDRGRPRKHTRSSRSCKLANQKSIFKFLKIEKIENNDKRNENFITSMCNLLCASDERSVFYPDVNFWIFANNLKTRGYKSHL